MEKYNKFFLGFIPGLIIPVVFLWAYLTKFFPAENLSFLQEIRQLYPTPIMGKLLLLASMPNLALVFAFYKTDSFKLATGMLIAAMPYFIASVFLL